MSTLVSIFSEAGETHRVDPGVERRRERSPPPGATRRVMVEIAGRRGSRQSWKTQRPSEISEHHAENHQAPVKQRFDSAAGPPPAGSACGSQPIRPTRTGAPRATSPASYFMIFRK